MSPRFKVFPIDFKYDFLRLCIGFWTKKLGRLKLISQLLI